MTYTTPRADQDILADLAPLLVARYETPEATADRQTLDRIGQLLAEALHAGLTPRRIASHARIPGQVVIEHLERPADVAAAHDAEIRHALRAVEVARQNRARSAHWMTLPADGSPFAKGMTKTDVAKLFGVSRPTLDEWIEKATA